MLVSRYEQLFSINPALCSPALLAQRAQIVHLALKYGTAFQLKDDTIYDALQLFDRVSCCGVTLNIAAWPLMLCSCLLLAARQVESPTMWPALEQVNLLTGFGADVLVAMERNVLMWLGHDVSTISPMRVIQLYLERLGHYLPEFKAVDRITKDLQTLVLKVACSPVVGLRPSLVGAAALLVVRRARGMVPAWPTVLQTMTDYSPSDGELAACVMHLEALMQQ